MKCQWTYIIVLVAVSGCGENQEGQRETAPAKVHSFASELDDLYKISDEYRKTIEAKIPVISEGPLADRLHTVAPRILDASDQPTMNVQFKVLDDKTVNAFALPRGYVFVTRGLLETLTEDSELAFVLGHEIAHIVRLH